MLIAEELVLLALDRDGTLAQSATGSHSYVEVGVTGALLAELGISGHLDLADGKIAAAEGSSPKHPLLAAALAAAAKHQGKSLKSRLPRIQKAAGWSQVVDGMVDRGMLGREKSTLRPTRHPVLDEAGQDEILRRVRQAAVGDGPLEPRTATLLALAGPCHLLEVVAPERSDRRRAKQRIAEATEHVPAAVAAKKAIEAMETAGSVAAASGGAAAVAGS